MQPRTYICKERDVIHYPLKNDWSKYQSFMILISHFILPTNRRLRAIKLHCVLQSSPTARMQRIWTWQPPPPWPWILLQQRWMQTNRSFWCLCSRTSATGKRTTCGHAGARVITSVWKAGVLWCVGGAHMLLFLVHFSSISLTTWSRSSAFWLAV
jgi:hypothetical protein